VSLKWSDSRLTGNRPASSFGARGHSERVTEYALTMARHFDLDDRKTNTLELAGFLHDIGKIAVPESVLHKPGRLTEEEFAVIQVDPRTGHDILRQMDGTETLAERCATTTSDGTERGILRDWPERIFLCFVACSPSPIHSTRWAAKGPVAIASPRRRYWPKSSGMPARSSIRKSSRPC